MYNWTTSMPSTIGWIDTTVEYTMEFVCHGCGGKGWVPVDGKAQICPICHGRGKLKHIPGGWYPRKKWEYIITSSSTSI